VSSVVDFTRMSIRRCMWIEERRDVIVRDRWKTGYIQVETLCADEPPDTGASGLANACDTCT
jgi:hypothetical protein